MENEARGRKRKRFTSQPITIMVGSADDTETHTVHAGILEEHSAFWRSALKKCWEEGAEGKIKLPEDDRDAVSTYLEWIYSSKIEITPLRNDRMPGSEIQTEFEHLARAYVFGEKIQDNKFCNKTMDAILLRAIGPKGDTKYNIPTTKAINIIYNGTPEGSPARQLCVWLHTYWGHPKSIKSPEEGEHPEFLRDLSRSLLDFRGCPRFPFQVGPQQAWHKKS